MPRPALRSRSKRRTQVKVPGGRVAHRYTARKDSKAKCQCGKELHGIARASATQRKNSPRTAKTVQRPYGGNLCSKCVRQKIRIETRLE